MPEIDETGFFQVSYLDLVRCGGRTSRLNARKKAEKPKPKFRSYAEARKGRENFRKRLVEVKNES